MPITGLPTFEDNQILTAGELNQVVQVIESKFSAITADDFTWPLVAQGNIDFDQQHSIVGLRTFWNYINANEYDSLQLAVDAAEAAGGGCVIIPPDTTITADSVNIEQSSIWIAGCGPSSKIQLTGGASGGYLMRTGTGTLTDIGLVNLTLDGQSVSAQDGMQFRFVDGCTVKGVKFEDFDGSALVFTNAGTPGTQRCQNVLVSDCRFIDGGDAHIEGVDIEFGIFENIISSGATATAAINFEPATSAGYLKHLAFDNVIITDVTGIGMQVLGASGTEDDKWSIVSVIGAQISSTTGTAMIIGDTAKVIKAIVVKGCNIPSATGIGIRAQSVGGLIAENYVQNATGDAIDIVSATDLQVCNNHLQDCGANAVDAESSADCQVYSNNVIDATTEGVRKDSATGLRSYDNLGDMGLGTSFIDFGTWTASGGAATTVYTLTIPGNTLSKKGDSIRVRCYGDCDGTGTVGTAVVRVGGSDAGVADYRGPASQAEWSIDTWITLDDDDQQGFRYMSRAMSRDAYSYYPSSGGSAQDFSGDLVLDVRLDPGDANNATLQQIFVEFHKGQN